MVDVVISAGHEGGYRNGRLGRKVKTSGTSGVPGGPAERDLTPRVADHAAIALRAAGYTVERVTAYYPRVIECKLAVAIHFDGARTPCKSGASIGYPKGHPIGSNKPAADSWKKLYSTVWPFRWMPDNFTKNLSGYYGYAWTKTEVAELVLELGELTCPEQADWLIPRAESGYLGRVLAHWISGQLGGKVVPMPDEPVERWVSMSGITAVLESAILALGRAELVTKKVDKLAEHSEEVTSALSTVVVDLRRLTGGR